MRKQPKIKIPKSTSILILDLLALSLCVFYVVYTALSYANLPDKIPIHYDLSGEVDGIGGKSVILLLVGIGLRLFLMHRVGNEYPHTCNYAVQVTEDNAVAQ